MERRQSGGSSASGSAAPPSPSKNSEVGVDRPRMVKLPSAAAAALRRARSTEFYDYFVGPGCAFGGDVANGHSRKLLTQKTAHFVSTNHLDSFLGGDAKGGSGGMDQRTSIGSRGGSLVRGSPGDKQEESDTGGSSEDSSNESGDSDASDQAGGLKNLAPGVYEWVRGRIGTKEKLALCIIFVAVECGRFYMFEYAVVPTVNPVSIFFASDLLSAILACIVTVGLEGTGACKYIFNGRGLLRVSAMALLFTVSTGMTALAWKTGLSPAVNNLLGKLYLPLAAVASYFAFKRKYGLLEWLSLSMTMLSIAAFMLLRDRCHYNYCHTFKLRDRDANKLGILFVLLSVCASATASILMERILQKRTSSGKKGEHGYYIYRAQLDCVTTVLWLVAMLWTAIAPTPWAPWVVATEPEMSRQQQKVHMLFGTWTKRQYFCVALLVAQRWLAGVMVQQFSTVSRGIVTSISTVLVVMVGDFLQNNKYDIEERFRPSLMITTVVMLSALIFQTGRLNVKHVRDHLEDDIRRGPVSVASVASSVKEKLSRLRTQRGGVKDVLIPLMKYSVMFNYILADSLRSILAMVVQSNRYIVPQTIAVMSPVIGVLFASAMTLQSQGTEGLIRAWDYKKIAKFALCGLLQALTQSMMSVAYALGTSPALVVGLGKIYTPVVAILSRYLLGRFFLWMEWFALIILTCTALAFSIMQNVGQAAHPSHAGNLGMILVAGSAICSAMMSLAMEKFMKGETEPFIIQKVRLDLGGVFFAIILMPLMGLMATAPGNTRQDLAFWVYRAGPDYWGCYELAVDHPVGATRGCNQTTGEFMANWTLIGNSTSLLKKASECGCGSGVFLGWGSNYMIYIFVLVSVFHSWVIGKLVSQFSSVDRAVADGIPLLLIFFFLDPAASRVPLEPFRAAYSQGPLPFPPADWARDLVCLILPLSGWTFSSASSQMQKVIDRIEVSPGTKEDATDCSMEEEEEKNEEEEEDDGDFTSDSDRADETGRSTISC